MCGKDMEAYKRSIANSFMISADNAHGVHPNYTDKADPTNRPYLNEGIVVKYNANQKYTTDAVSASIFKEICKRAGVPVQTYVNRSDIAGGSTLGNISNAHISLNTVDIGLAQLSMHSPYETAGIKDTKYMIDAIKKFYETSIYTNRNGSITLR
jgi:aspartyl aminopeptidase